MLPGMKNNKQPFHRKTFLIPRKSRLRATKTPEEDETIRKPVAEKLQKTTHGRLTATGGQYQISGEYRIL